MRLSQCMRINRYVSLIIFQIRIIHNVVGNTIHNQKPIIVIVRINECRCEDKSFDRLKMPHLCQNWSCHENRPALPMYKNNFFDVKNFIFFCRITSKQMPVQHIYEGKLSLLPLNITGILNQN